MSCFSDSASFESTEELWQKMKTRSEPVTAIWAPFSFLSHTHAHTDTISVNTSAECNPVQRLKKKS